MLGELDSANNPGFTSYSLKHYGVSDNVVLDLTGVEFFGASCFASLHRFNVKHIANGGYWALVPSRSVSRLLRICDPEGALPTAESVEGALFMLRDPWALLSSDQTAAIPDESEFRASAAG